MAGTKEGALKAKMKNLAKDPDYYAKIGAIGGRQGTTGGFYANPELARVAGQKGGRISRPGPRKPKVEPSKSMVEKLFGWFKRT